MAPSSKADFIAAGLDMHDGTSISSLESGIVATLSQGLYTVVLQSSTGSGFGVGLLELYELENGTKEKARLENVSTRCLVKTGDEQAISGIIVGDPTQGGNSAIPKRSILMLGLGPSLPSTISPKLANPFLQLYNSSGGLMSQDDSWGNLTSKPLDELTQQGLSPTNSLESALWPILSSGTYTTILSGVGGGTGIGQITMYEY
jgi:hypothetical protein